MINITTAAVMSFGDVVSLREWIELCIFGVFTLALVVYNVYLRRKIIFYKAEIK